MPYNYTNSTVYNAQPATSTGKTTLGERGVGGICNYTRLSQVIFNWPTGEWTANSERQIGVDAPTPSGGYVHKDSNTLHLALSILFCTFEIDDETGMTMKTIKIHVPPDLAKAFEKADIERRKKAELFINAWLTDFFSDQTANERLLDIMKKATAEAKANDFNEAELKELLKKDE